MMKRSNIQIIEIPSVDIYNAKFRAYKSWYNMIDRCINLRCSNYMNYGNRGINVCDSWLKFDNFYKDMGGRPKGLTLERRDNNKGYSLNNCRWATVAEQTNNTRRNRLFIAYGPEGQIKTTKKQNLFARKFNLNVGNINSCLHKSVKLTRIGLSSFLFL